MRRRNGSPGACWLALLVMWTGPFGSTLITAQDDEPSGPRGGAAQMTPGSRALPVLLNAEAVEGSVEGPRLSLDPVALRPMVLYDGGNKTQQVRLINNGALPARFVVEHQMAGLFGGWLGVSPSSGTVLPGEPLPLTISFVTEDIWQGSYKGSVTISSGQQRAVLHAHLLYFCPDILKSAEDPPSITFPADGVAITEIPPLWDTTDSAGADAVWAEVPIRFNRPVDQMLPVSGLDGATVVEVVRLDTRGSMCSDFAARIRAPIDPWKEASKPICFEIKGGINLTVDEATTLPDVSEHCVIAQHQPHGRLFGVFMAQSGDAGLVTSLEEVTILAMFSKPLDEVTLRRSSFIISGPPSPSVTSLRKIGASGTQWHVQVDVGHQYTGEVRVRVSSDVEDLSGRRLVPVPVLTFTREAYVPLQSAGYAIKKGPAATVLS